MTLAVVTYLWGDKYGTDYVVKLRNGLKRHMEERYRFICISDRAVDVPGVENFNIPIEDMHLTQVKGCFARLRLFDPAFQKELGLQDRIVSIDLDAIVCGPLGPLFARPNNFLIVQGANSRNPCPYNGSLWMLRAGYRPETWSGFSLAVAARVANSYEFPDDQGWLWHSIPNAPAWRVGSQSGIYAFKKPGWPKGDDLPGDARLVAFPGWRDPSKFQDLPWIKYHWGAE